MIYLAQKIISSFISALQQSLILIFAMIKAYMIDQITDPILWKTNKNAEF